VIDESIRGSECPRCGKFALIRRQGWDIESKPCTTEAECIANLRTRIDEIEQRLDRHNF
jgi:hypothetical protein